MADESEVAKPRKLGRWLGGGTSRPAGETVLLLTWHIFQWLLGMVPVAKLASSTDFVRTNFLLSTFLPSSKTITKNMNSMGRRGYWGRYL